MYPRSETDPADFAERFERDPQAELEAIREREWDDLREYVREFAARHDWPSTLRCVAQALEADQAARQELDRRR